jgi:metal-responsive CopG/Arc/MetJ family transcriptional regulator
MTTVTGHFPKTKITVTLSPDLVRQLDLLLSSSGAGSRSRLVEEALQRWLHDQAQKELERQTEQYYRSLSKTERKENRQWSKISARSARQLWDK